MFSYLVVVAVALCSTVLERGHRTSPEHILDRKRSRQPNESFITRTLPLHRVHKYIAPKATNADCYDGLSDCDTVLLKLCGWLLDPEVPR